jgi:hypothetical protein
MYMPLKFPTKMHLRSTTTDAVCREMLEPGSSALCEVERQVLDNEEIVVCPACSIGKAKVF